MRVILVLGLAILASVSAHVEVNSFYHESFGIPEAQRIKDIEDKIIANQKLQEDERIVGGAIAPTNAHPYLVSLSIIYICNKIPTQFF